MNYYGGKNLPAKLRSRRRKAAKCKSLGLNAQSLSVCINKAELIKNELLAKRAEKSVKPARAALKVKNAEVKPEVKAEVKPAEAKPAVEKAEVKPEAKAEVKSAEAIKPEVKEVKEIKEAKAKKAEPQKTEVKAAKSKVEKADGEVKEAKTKKAEVKEAKAKKTEPPKSEVKEPKAKKAEDKKPKAEAVIEATPAEDVKPTEVAEPAADVAEIKVESVETEEKTQSPAEGANETPIENTAEEQTEEPTEKTPEKITEHTAEEPTETKAEVAPETANETPIENTAEGQTEEPTEVAPEKTEEKTKLDPTENAELLSKIATKRARKLIYAPKEAIYEVTGIKIEVDGKKNDKGVKVKDILEAEIKEGLKLGYLDKYDGLKTSEIKEEYENDTVWEIAEQEFKKMGLLLDGDKIKVYVFDWTGTCCHHVGYIPDDKAAELIPYLADMDKYSFDLDGIITGGKSKTVTKDPKTGKITITKGKDGGYGIDLDVTIINRKD